jgi:outer membrane receptor protein involved in Fe transport
VGPRFDGNDFSNRDFPKLPSYTVWDASVRVDYGKFQFSAGIRNLFDRAYATIAYSGGLYPMPERNAFVAVRWTP